MSRRMRFLTTHLWIPVRAFVGTAPTITRQRSFHCSQPVRHEATTTTRSTKKTLVRDTKLAGRLRFYKSVGVTPVPAPWEELGSVSSNGMMDSPISAGVDGTQSASGVSLKAPTRESLQHLLTPRHLDDNNNNSNNNSHWFGVTLDGRSIKTPLGQTLAVPSQSLAWAIAAEWDAQAKTLQPAQMPLMTLVCTTLDQTTAHPEVSRDQILSYLPTDTICYWADPAEDRILHRKQQQSWKSLHEWVAETLGTDKPAYAVGTSEGLIMSRAGRQSKTTAGLPHPETFVQAATAWVEGLDAWQLTAAHSVAATAKSFLIAKAVVTCHPNYYNSAAHPFAQDLTKAVLAARVEEEFQIESWGLVEGGHDYDRLNCSIQVHAAHFLSSSIAAEYVD